MMNIKKIITTAATFLAAVALFCGNANGSGPTPIKDLQLTSSANGGWYNFTNLNYVVSSNVVSSNIIAGTLTLGGTTLTNWPTSATWGLISGTINSQTDLWSYLSWVQATSNTVNNGTQRWDTAYDTANWASNNTVAVSNSWYGSIAYLIASADTQRWNNAYNIAVATSNSWYGSPAYLIASGDTQRWNTAGLTATWASNNTVAVSNSWYGSIAYLIASADTQRWNTAGLTATWASNNTVAVSNSWYGSSAYLIASSDTQRWNNAYDISVATSNDWYGSVARLIISSDTQRWNTAGLTATWASNNTVAVSNSWYGSIAYLIGSSDTQRWNTAGIEATWASNGVVTLNGQTNAYAYLAKSNVFTALNTFSAGVLLTNNTDSVGRYNDARIMIGSFNPANSSSIEEGGWGNMILGWDYQDPDPSHIGFNTMDKWCNGCMFLGGSWLGASNWMKSANASIQLSSGNQYMSSMGISNASSVIQMGNQEFSDILVSDSTGIIQMFSGSHVTSHVHNVISGIILGNSHVENATDVIVVGNNQSAHGDGSITAAGGFWSTNSPASDNWMVNWQRMTNYLAGFPTSNWDIAYDTAIWASNGVVALNNRTQDWNTAYNTANWASNNTVAVSNSWYGSSAYLIASGDTQRWNTAGIEATWASNGVVALNNGTQNWNTAYNTANWASNNTVAVSNSWYGSIAYLIGSSDTQRWNTAGIEATWASNNTVAVSNSWYGSAAYLIASGDTQRWNNAYDIAVATSNSWYGSTAYLIGSSDTQRWNTAGLTATWASNNTVAVSNSWFGSVAYLIVSGDTQNWNTAYNWVNAYATAVPYLASNNVFTGTNTFASALVVTNDGRSIWGGAEAGFESYFDISNIDPTAYGASKHGYTTQGGSMTIGANSVGAMQRGYVTQSGSMVIGSGARGAIQLGSCNGAFTSATNTGIGSIQSVNLTGLQKALLTGNNSIALGAGTNTDDRAIVAGNYQISHGAETITAGGGFWSTNSPASDNWLVNYQRMTNWVSGRGYRTNESDTLQAVLNRGATGSNVVSLTATNKAGSYAGALQVSGGGAFNEGIYAERGDGIGAGYFTCVSATVELAKNTYAIDASVGAINANATSGFTEGGTNLHNIFAALGQTNTFTKTNTFDVTVLGNGGFYSTNSPASDNWMVNWQTMTNFVGGEQGVVNLSSTGTNTVNFSKVYNVVKIPIIQTYQGSSYMITYEVISATTSNAVFIARNSGGLEVNPSILASWNIPAGQNGTLVQADAIYTNNVSMAFNNTNLVQASGSNLAWNTYTIVNGRVYIASTNGLAGSQFSQPSQFTIRSDSSLSRDSVLYRWTNINMYATYMTNSAGAGTNILYLNDASGIPNGGLLYLMDGTPEFVGVTNVIGSAVYLESAVAGAHSASSGVSLVKEFAAYAYDSTSAGKVWYSMRFNNSYSISNLTVAIKYKK